MKFSLSIVTLPLPERQLRTSFELNLAGHLRTSVEMNLSWSEIIVVIATVIIAITITALA